MIMVKNRALFKVLLAILIVSAAALGYFSYSQSQKINLQEQEIFTLQDAVQSKDSEIESLNNNIVELESEVEVLSEDVESKEERINEQQQVIIEKTTEIGKVTEIAKDRQEEILRLKETQQKLSEQGKLIVDEYGQTLILYDNAEVFSSQSQYAEMLQSDPVDYGSLGMPFIYFKDESKETEDGLVLGTYSALYNYIFIYRDNDNVRTLYHEIAHLIYFKYFINVENNLDIWLGVYDNLKQNNLLSTEYAKNSPEEGFAEEYSVYKTGLKDQPEVLKQLFSQIDGLID